MVARRNPGNFGPAIGPQSRRPAQCSSFPPVANTTRRRRRRQASLSLGTRYIEHLLTSSNRRYYTDDTITVGENTNTTTLAKSPRPVTDCSPTTSKSRILPARSARELRVASTAPRLLNPHSSSSSPPPSTLRLRPIQTTPLRARALPARYYCSEENFIRRLFSATPGTIHTQRCEPLKTRSASSRSWTE